MKAPIPSINNACRVIIILGLLSLILSCAKDPGEGGTSSIIGKVYIEDYNSSGDLVAEYFAPDEKVYIIYGDQPIYNDDTRTHTDGTYLFKNLYRGEYTLFSYSKCDTCPSPNVPVYQKIRISKRGRQMLAPTITIKK